MTKYFRQKLPNICPCSEPPSEPREPGIVDFDNKSVTLRWNKPTDSGGRPITHFIIQKKDKFGGWFDALITDDDNCMATIDELEARVPGLSEGEISVLKYKDLMLLLLSR